MSGRGVEYGTKSTLLPRNPLSVDHVVVDGSEVTVFSNTADQGVADRG
jgi:hypothetical protein